MPNQIAPRMPDDEWLGLRKSIGEAVEQAGAAQIDYAQDRAKRVQKREDARHRTWSSNADKARFVSSDGCEISKQVFYDHYGDYLKFIGRPFTSHELTTRLNVLLKKLSQE